MRRTALPQAVFCAAAMLALLPHATPRALAQADTPPAAAAATPRGENFSAKPAPALFASDCTGAGCHRGPQGLAKRAGLASFLREHYTNSRESAAALANYLASIPSGPAPGERPTRQSTQTPATTPTTPGQRPRRGTEPADPPKPSAEIPPKPSAEIPPKPEPPGRGQRGQRGRQAVAVPPPEPAAAAPPPPQQFDIFD
jgi:hypothetical protein